MATKPTAPTVPNPPLRSFGSTQFVADSETWFTFEAGPLYTYIVDGIDYIDETNTDVQAAAVAANLFDLPLAGLGGYVVGVNSGEDGFEAVEITEYNVSPFMITLLDDADAATARGTLGLGTFAEANTAAYVQSQGVWNAGTSTTESTITPAKLGEAVVQLSSRKLIAEEVLSSDAVTDFTSFSPSDYDWYEFVFISVNPSVDGTGFHVQFSSDGGATFDSGASDYQYNRTDGAGTTSSRIVLDNTEVGSGTGGVCGDMRMYATGDASPTMVTWHLAHTTSGPVMVESVGSGRRVASTVIDAVRFTFDSGDLETGKILMYGVRG